MARPRSEPAEAQVRLLLSRARELRKNPTDAEKRLWSRLRMDQFHGLRFVRQEVIGAHIVDFCCRKQFLAIELDGGQHSSQTTHDLGRTAALRRRGYRVLRFWNNEVMTNLDGVLALIEQSVALEADERP